MRSAFADHASRLANHFRVGPPTTIMNRQTAGDHQPFQPKPILGDALFTAFSTRSNGVTKVSSVPDLRSRRRRGSMRGKRARRHGRQLFKRHIDVELTRRRTVRLEARDNISQYSRRVRATLDSNVKTHHV